MGEERSKGTAKTLGSAAVGAGAAAVATATTACCVPVVGPIVVTLLGASGAAWAAGLSRFSPWVLAGSGALLIYAWYSAYWARRKPSKVTCRQRRPLSVRIVLWAGTALWLFALAVNLLQLSGHA